MGPDDGAGWSPQASMQDSVKAESTADIVARRITGAILAGTFPPGTRLREESLASAYGVSRTPIREALIQLASSGLVELTRNRGATVLQLTADDIEDVYHVRAVLESEAASLATRRATPELLDYLGRSCDRLALLHDAPATEQLAADTDFHYSIARASGSPRLHALIRQVSAVPEAYRSTMAYLPPDMAAAEAQHRSVLEAMRDRRSASAAKAMRRHVDWACRLAVARLTAGRTG